MAPQKDLPMMVRPCIACLMYPEYNNPTKMVEDLYYICLLSIFHLLVEVIDLLGRCL